MNALALVCNLYADGPRSLQRLREDGRHELEDVLELSPSRLVELLGMSPRTVERFLREAETLGRRVGSEFLDPESERDEEALDSRGEELARRLAPETVDGLDAVTCRQLNGVGVHSIAQLASRDALELANVTGLPFSGIRRLQFLARRGAGIVAAPAAGEVLPVPRAKVAAAAGNRDAPKVSLAEGPSRPVPAGFETELSEHARDQAAGPFA